MMIYPLAVTIVALCFAGAMYYQFAERHKPYQLVWALSLTMGGLAGLSFLLFLLTDRSALFFRLYYLFGALLMAAYLGLGSVYLLAPRRPANLTALAVTVVGLVGLLVLLFTPIHGSALHASAVEAGTNVVSGPVVIVIAVMNTFGAVAVIGGAIFSGWRLYRGRGPGRLLVSNVLIATGTILASLAGTLARLTGNGSWFWVLLAAGFVVLFAGFLLTTRQAARLAERRAHMGRTASGA